MERNYQKEYALAVQKISELQELVFAYQAKYDDTAQQLEEYQEQEKQGGE